MTKTEKSFLKSKFKDINNQLGKIERKIERINQSMGDIHNSVSDIGTYTDAESENCAKIREDLKRIDSEYKEITKNYSYLKDYLTTVESDLDNIRGRL